MLHEQVKEHISQLSDEDLAEYVEASPNQYEPEALAFAHFELERRNIDSTRAAVLHAEAKTHVATKAVEASAAEMLPLTVEQKVWSFIGGCFIGSLIALLLLLFAWTRFRQRGEYLRASQMWRFVLFGVGFMILVGLGLSLHAMLSR
jgi:hypothetical protein